MTTISGYRFSIDLDDRGFSTGMRTMAKEANALKNVMRANFNELKNSEGIYSAYAGKIQDAQNVIETYKGAIEKAEKANESIRAEMEKTGSTSDKQKEAMIRNVNTIARYNNQIARLQQQQETARRAMESMNIGVDRARITTEAITTSTKKFAQSLNETGHFFKEAKVNAEGLKLQQQALTNQFQAELRATDSQKNKLTELTTKYKTTSEEVERLKNKLVSLRDTQAKASITPQSGLLKDTSEKRIIEASNELKRQQNILNGTREEIAKQNKEYSNQVTKVNEVGVALGRINRNAKTKTGFVSRMSQGFGNFNTKLKESTSHTREWASSVKQGFQTASIAAGGLAAAAGVGIKMAGDLQTRYKQVTNLAVTGGEKEKEAIKNVNLMRKDGAKLSVEYAESQKDIAEQYLELTKRGYTTTAALGSMRTMLEASKASGDDFQDVVKTTSSVVDGFGLRVENNAKKMSENTKRVANSIAYVADKTASGFQDLGVGMSYVSTTAHNAGFSVEQTAAALGTLSNAGMEGSIAGTGLRKVIQSLVAPTKGAKAALTEAKLSVNDFKDASGKLLPVSDIFKKIKGHIQGMSQVQQGAFFKAVFGATGSQAAQVLAKDADEIANLTKEAENASKSYRGLGYVHNLAMKNMQTAQNQLKSLKAAGESIAINAGAKLLPAVTKVAQALNQWVISKEGQKSLGEFNKGVEGVANTVGKHADDIIKFTLGVADGFKNTLMFTGAVVKGIGDIASKIAPVKAIFDFIGGKVKDFTKWIGGGSISKGIGVMTGAFIATIGVLKIVHKGLEGVKAVSDDFGTLRSWIKGDSEIKVRTALMKEQLAIQKEMLQISKEQAGIGSSKPGDKIKGGSSSSSDALSDAIDLADTISDSKSEGKVVAEGAKHAKWYQKGFLGKITGFPGKIASKFASTKFGGKLVSAGSKFAGFFKKGFSKLNPKNWKIFSKFGKSAAKAGEEGGVKLAEGVATKASSGGLLSKIGALGKGLGGKLLGGIDIAFSAFDLFGQFKKPARKRDARQIGMDAGSLIGGGVGAILGSIIPGAGTAAGASLGAGIGSAVGIFLPEISKGLDVISSLIGKVLGGAFNLVKGPVNSFLGFMDDAFHGRWSKIGTNIKKNWNGWLKDMGNGWKSFAKNVQGWWNGTVKGFQQGHGFQSMFGLWQDPKKSSSSTPKGKVTSHEFKSLGGNHYSKADIASVKEMNAAITAYTNSLKNLKATIKNNDPTKELKAMNKFLGSNTKGWTEAAKPIKKIGDAFEYLTKFTSNMAKKDAFATFNKDLPKLEKSLKKYVPSIKKQIEKLADALNPKGKKSITRGSQQISEALGYVISALKNINGPLKTTASNFYSFKKSVSTLTGKKNGVLALQKDVEKLSKSLDSKLNKKITDLADTLSKAKLDSQFKAIKSPLDSIAKDFKDLSTPLKNAKDAFKQLSSTMKSFASYGNQKNPLDKMVDSINNLKNVLSTAKGQKGLASEFKDLTSAFGSSSKKGSSGFLGAIIKADKPMSSLASSFKTMDKPFKDFIGTLNKASGGKKNIFDTLADGLTKLQKVLASGKKKNSLTKEIEDISSALGSSKGKKTTGFIRALTDLNKPLQNVASSFSRITKPITALNKSMILFKGKKNPLQSMADGFKALNKELVTKGKDSLVTKLEDIGKVFEGKKKSKGLATEINDTVKPLKSMVTYFSKLTKPLDEDTRGLKKFKDLLSYFTGKNLGFKGLRADVEELTDTLKKNPFGTILSKQARIANEGLSKYNFAVRFQLYVDLTLALTNSFAKKFASAWKKAWSPLNKTASDALTKVRKTQSSFENKAISSFKSFGSRLKSTFSSAMNALPGIASNAMRQIVSRLNAGIGGVNSVINQFGGSSKLSYIRYANGTKNTHPGGHMMINDSTRPDYKELVKFPGRPWAMFEGRNVLIPNAPKGTEVLSGEDTKKVMNANGIYHYADGTGDIDDIINKIDKNPLQVLRSAFFKKASFSNGATVVRDLGQAMANGFLVAIKDKFKSIADEASTALNPDGTSAAPTGSHLNWLKQAGFPESWIAPTAWIIARESGWRVNATNPGSGAYGIPQSLPGSKMAAAGRDWRTNPITQLKWMRNYIKERYGTASNAQAFWRRNHYYANGGFVTKHQTAELGEGNLPEAVIPLDPTKESLSMKLVSQVLAQLSNNYKGTGLDGNDTDVKDLLTKISDNISALAVIMNTYLASNQTVHTTIEMDKRKIAEAITKNIRTEMAQLALRGGQGFSAR
ncbi:phage tail tape measure protein [Lactobacillus mulieris]|uniref:Phage tail tape measure protein n=1 Tax=Lactobacillus mulieris TaxID=2508708 RepID=A0AAP3GVH2_9LACO|nr:phage tail tape measure protein [Lactobacillus mulieris]MCZ3844169.1 phage tail tape measure protein [Lactobacillus mulieris]MCZ3875829.1 phage tail tape measure protein [Lactobacillus mulieris]